MTVENATIARPGPPRAARRWWFGVWFVSAAICAAATWYFAAVFVPHERAAAIGVRRNRLSAMADDRKVAITASVSDRHSDARGEAVDKKKGRTEE